MAALTTAIAARTGTVCTPVALGSTNTIAQNDADSGAVLVVQVGSTPTNLTWTDGGHTSAGTAAGSVSPITIAANTAQAFGNLSAYADSTGTITFALSSTTGATGMLVRKP